MKARYVDRLKQQLPVGRTVKIETRRAGTRIGVVLGVAEDYVDTCVLAENLGYHSSPITTELSEVIRVDLVHSSGEEEGLYTIDECDWSEFKNKCFPDSPKEHGTGITGYLVEVELEHGKTLEFIPQDSRYQGLHCCFEKNKFVHTVRARKMVGIHWDHWLSTEIGSIVQ